MTGYVRKCRMAGLASLVVVAFATAPGGANTICKGVAPYQTCQSLKVAVIPKAHRKFRGNVASGTKKLTIRTKTAGKYELKSKANANGLTATATNKFKSKP